MNTPRLDEIIGGPADCRFYPKITCVDGFTLSVQASAGRYCAPRPNHFKLDEWLGPYTHVEVGFPSAQPEPWDDWEDYCEDLNYPTGTVYGRVPVEIVSDLIALHGGEA